MKRMADSFCSTLSLVYCDEGLGTKENVFSFGTGAALACGNLPTEIFLGTDRRDPSGFHPRFPKIQ
jgi:hypothetical protein